MTHQSLQNSNFFCSMNSWNNFTNRFRTFCPSCFLNHHKNSSQMWNVFYWFTSILRQFVYSVIQFTLRDLEVDEMKYFAIISKIQIVITNCELIRSNLCVDRFRFFFFLNEVSFLYNIFNFIVVSFYTRILLSFFHKRK